MADEDVRMEFLGTLVKSGFRGIVEGNMKYTAEQQKKALITASKACNLDAHITTFERRSDLTTWADKIIGIFYRKSMPVKRSYVMCSTLYGLFLHKRGRSGIYICRIC